MKKIFILLLLGFFLSAYAEESAKCDNKLALETLGNLLKKGIWGRYNMYFYHKLGGKKGDHEGPLDKAQNDFRLYLDKDVKIKFSSFRTQSKDEFSCRCIAKVELIFPEPPDSVKSVQRTADLNLNNLAPGLSTVFNETKEMDNVIYDITLTDDKKEVYTGFVNINTRTVEFQYDKFL